MDSEKENIPVDAGEGLQVVAHTADTEHMDLAAVVAEATATQTCTVTPLQATTSHYNSSLC